MRMTKLSEFAYFVTTKIDVKKLTRSNYIGVDNMLQNKNGITQSEYLPDNGYAIAFQKNDILIGNIRPYLKKIWLATFDGGCSQDVLCLRCNNSCLSGFIFSLLSQDCFFDYVMKGSKGTRMARGDKKHILNYKFCDIPNKEQIGQLITNLNNKIFLNNQINDNLLQTSLSYFKHKFLSKTPNGKLNEILIEHAKSQIQVNQAKKSCGNIPFFTSGDEILFSNTEISKTSSCFLNTGGNADVKFFAGSAGYSTDTWCISAKGNLTEYLFLYLLTYKEELQKKYFQGTGLKHLQKDQLRNKEIYIPSEDEIAAMNELLIPNLKAYSSNFIQNHRLKRLRDYLLPLLLNGQVTIK